MATQRVNTIDRGDGVVLTKKETGEKGVLYSKVKTEHTDLIKKTE